MKTINLSKYAPAITMKNVGIVNQDIREGLQSNKPFAIDFKGIEGIEMAAASELLNPLRSKYGTRYRQEVQFQNVNPLVGNAFVFSGRTDSTAVSSPRRKSFISRMFFTLLLLLTLGVGQMWADMGFENSNNGVKFNRTPLGGSSAEWNTSHGRTRDDVDLGNVTALTLTGWYVKFYQNEDNMCGEAKLHYRIYRTDNTPGAYTSNDCATFSWPGSWSNGWRYPTAYRNSMSVNVLYGLASGIYYFEYYFTNLVKGNNGDYSSCNKTIYCSNNSNNFKDKFTIKPNALSSFSVTRSGYSAGSGTDKDPYIIARGGSLTLTGVGSGGTSDANSTIKYKYGSSGWQTTSYTISDITSTTKQSITVKGARRHNSQDLGSDESSVTIYYQAETTYSVSISSGSPSSVLAGANYTTPTITASNVTGYHFDHWSISGSAAVASTTTSPTTVTATGSGATITANYEPNEYTITLDDNGSYQGDGSATITYDDNNLSISSHASRTGWNVAGYWSASGNQQGVQVIDAAGNLIANVSGFTDASGNWINSTENLKLYADWSQTYSLAVEAGAGVSSVTGSNDNVTLNEEYAISATPTSGYTFSSWTASPAENATFDDASSASTNVTVKNGNVTVTGTATENMTTVTVNVSPAGAGTLTVASSSFTPGNTTTAGVTTSRTVVATANSGYTFLGWYKSGNTAGTSSTNTYTLKGNGSAGTGTLTAVFASNATAGWYLIGQPFGNNWGTDNHSYPMNLKYRGMSDVYMRVVAFGGGSGSYFKPMKNNSPYGQTAAKTDVSVVTGTQYAISATSAENTAFITNGQGTVWCIVDETNSKFWVQTPADYFPVTLSNGSSGNTLSGTEGTIALTTNNYGNLATTYYALSERINISVTAKSGYWIDDISINGTSLVENRNSASWSGYTTMPSANATLTVTYNRIYSLSYNANGGSGAAPATTYYISGTNATAAAANTFTNPSYYTFGGWNTEQYITGSSYAAGASVPMNANTTLYAKWTRSVTLNRNTATSGSTSVTATYKCATLPTITNPSLDGYVFGGWYTADDGSGDIVINTSGALQANKSNWTDASSRFTRTASAATLYAKWTQTVTLNANTSYHGSGDNTSATIILNATAKSSITHCTPATGYQRTGYYTAATGGVKVLNADGSFAGSSISDDDDDYISSSKWVHAGNTTLYAHYEPIKYTVTLNAGTGGSGSGTMEIYYDAAGYDTWSHDITQTGYHIAGWYYNAGSLKVLNADGTFASSSVSGYITSNKWTKAADCELQAWWDPNGYTVTLDKQTEAEGYSASGTVGNQDVAYNTILPTITGTAPTAANGYAFMGFYTEEGGEGLKVINANLTWVASVAGYTNGSSQWIHDGNVTLYAYYKKAEITGITFTDGAVVAPSTSKTVTAVIDPTPTGTTTVCWRVLYSNDNPMDPQPSFSSVSGNSVSFTAPATSGMYKMEAVLHLGSGCEGTELSTYVANFQVAGDHTVTVQYKDASGNVIAPSGSVTGKPLEWSSAIEAPEIFGYEFDHWKAGDGVTLSEDGTSALGEDESDEETIYIKAVYDGKLTAVYSQKSIIYFKNTLGWSNVFVNFMTGSYWNSDNGSGNGNSYYVRNQQMSLVPGTTDIYYYEYSCSTSKYVSFTSASQNGADNFWAANPGVNVVYPACRGNDLADKVNDLGFYAKTPMFVPLKDQPAIVKNSKNSGKANYYNDGYWTKYTAGTGYTLEIYYDNDASECIQSIPFTSADDLMPMKAVVDLEASTTYRFQLKRDGDVYYGNSGTMTYANHGAGTAWEMSTEAKRRNDANTADIFAMCKLTTNASGNYTFNLSYSGNSATPVHYCLRMEVDYPIANNDYRLIYKDDVQTKDIKSAIVTKANNSKDTVSFFVRPGSTPVLKIQQATVNPSTGAITWNDYSTISTCVDNTGTDALSKDSVYNICLIMNGTGAISVENVEGYNGNFYIRTNAAGSSKWDNYRSADHLMTYSEYSEKNADYSHYFMAYVGNGTNIKFVVANDYAPNISDTLKQQTYRGGDSYHVNSAGDIGADANVRFMWNKNNNAVYRAYLAAAKSDGSKFLVLRADDDDDLMDENGNALLNSANSGEAGYNHKAPDNCMQFIDDDNWIYETTVKVKPSAYVKLYAYFNTKYFYYKGVDNDYFDAENAIQLMTGDGSAEKLHVIYDFKTDRLMAAWMPSGDISSEREINADVMFLREHQGDIEQLTFSENAISGKMGSISAIKTAYGVLRFNKWTLNNKSKADGHAVLNPGASRYERDLFYVSFPFRVAMNEVFGFGKYGQHWIIEEYDGAARAANGFWAETPTFWRFITDRKGKFFEPNQGYIIALDLDELGESSDVWNNGVENVELYFPSYGTMGDITNAEVTYELPSHECTINRPTPDGNRTIKDSHWNVMSVPTYVNTSNVTFSNTTWTATRPSFLYEWNMGDNSLTPRSGSGYTYHAMHAYIVQYYGNVTWTSTSVTPSSIVARERTAPSEVEFRIELSENEQVTDQAFVRLSNDEEVSAGFAFGEDMSKELNKTRSNIYTFIGTEQVAGNVLPMSEQTTVVPVGVIAKTTGDYTFAIPEGTEGIGVTLIDNETGIRTSLSALTYTVNLEAGTYDERFVLEISPISQVLTDIDNVQSDDVQGTKARKVMIDGILYIVKDGKVFDATGQRVK